MEPVPSSGERWKNAQRPNERKAALAADVARQAAAARINGLRALTDDELIASAPARTSFSHPDHERELQRRLKDSIWALEAETVKARIWAAWGAAVLGALTLALVALTIVLALKN
jgi:hypothetical protein